jgi:hypothetical protein
MKGQFYRRKSRRRAVVQIIDRLESILKAEDTYFDSLPDLPTFYEQSGESEYACFMIDQALDYLRSAYSGGALPF